MGKQKQKAETSPSLTSQVSFNNVDHKTTLKNKTENRKRIATCIHFEKRKQGFISINFTSDLYLLKMNRAYLQHDYFTDIITFNMNEGDLISGDLYISVDRVKDNAKQNKTTLKQELDRVIIHGILHLCGYNDKTKKQKETMRNKEDYYLSLLI